MQASLQLSDVCCRVVSLNFNCVDNSFHFQRSDHSASQLMAVLELLIL